MYTFCKYCILYRVIANYQIDRNKEKKPIIDNKMKYISISGRVAYCINCLENAILEFSDNPNSWDLLLIKLWQFTDVQYIDDWSDELAEYLPNSILSDTYDEEDCEYITKEEFDDLYQLYITSNELLLKMVTGIFEIGVTELHSRINDYSQHTLRRVGDLSDLMRQNEIALPDISDYIIYSIYDGKGWGKKFSGKELSSILEINRS